MSIRYFFASRFKRWMHKHDYHKMEQNRNIEPGKVLHWCHWCGLRGTTTDVNHPEFLAHSLGISIPVDFDFGALQKLRKDAKY